MTVQETIREAEATLERLRARLVAARKELSAIYARQEAIAYEVATGNFEAKALSGNLRISAARLSEEVAGILIPAIAKAEHRLEKANDPAAVDAERSRAEKAKEVADNVATLGALIDAGLKQAVDGSRAIREALLELRKLGAPVPSGQHLEVNLRIGLDAALMGFHREIRPVAPNDRRPFAESTEAWSRQAAKWADAILSAPSPVKPAAKATVLSLEANKHVRFQVLR